MSKVKKIHHVAIVVDDIEGSLSIWDTLGLKVESIREVPEQEARVAFLQLGDSEIELVEPTTDASGISRYLAKRGPGLHHLCIEVEDIEEIMERLNKNGFKLINSSPQVGNEGSKYAFIHPESTQGVLVELYELSGKNKVD